MDKEKNTQQIIYLLHNKCYTHIHNEALFFHEETWKFSGQWMVLETIMLSEISQTQKVK